jgi:hypothetical protein
MILPVENRGHTGRWFNESDLRNKQLCSHGHLDLKNADLRLVSIIWAISRRITRAKRRMKEWKKRAMTL